MKKVKQRSKMVEEFVQEFRRVARGSEYEERPLVEEFKQGMNGGCNQAKTNEIRMSPRSIEQQYE